MTTYEQATYALSEEMQSLVYWSSIYSPADADIDSVRAAYDAMCRHYTLPRDGKIEVEDRFVANDEHQVPVRVYLPKTNRPESGWPCVLYLHGGGWMVGGLDSHEFITSYLCQDLNAVVISVDYR
ncbi:alpha/beta hydrolase, partial [Acinetobacter soli]|uniref:alpha/beta hydrolase n=1 Tax=Acinetobacter soli TaxID=487316 RepID=UPI00125069DD